MARPNTAVPLIFRARDSAGEPATGLSISVTVFNPSNGQIWDWDTSAFSASPTSPTATLTEISAGNLPGFYYRSWPGDAAGTYVAFYTPPAGETADDYPAPVEIVVAPYAIDGSEMTLTAGERTAVQALILSDATPFAGARVDVAVSTRSSHAAADVWAVGARTLTSVSGLGIATQASVDALPAAVWATVTGNADWTYGECVELARKHITNRMDATATDSGTLILYDDDGSTAVVTQTLRDASGGAILVPTGSPALRGAAA